MGKHKHKKSKKSKRSSKYEDSSDEWEETTPLDEETSRSKTRSKMRKPLEDEKDGLDATNVSSASLSGNRHGSKSGDRPSWRKRDRATADHLERSPPRIELAGDETATEILKRPELGRHSPDRVTDRSARDGGPSCHGPPRAGELDADFNSPSETITREQAMDEDVSERREVSKTDTGRTRSPPARPAMKTTEKRDVDVGNQSAEVLSDDKMNQLSAKILKAELRGDQDTVQRLKTKLESANKARLEAKRYPKEAETTVVIITKGKHDSSERKRPGASTSGGRSDRKKNRIDDDWQRLEDKFVRKKVEEDERMDAVLQRAINKMEAGSRGVSAETNDDQDSEAEAHHDSDTAAAHSLGTAVKDRMKSETFMESCPFCIDSHMCVKHLVVHSGDNVSLMLPRNGSLTDFHCLLVPREHLPILTRADEDTWSEMQDLREMLSRIFEVEDMDCIFLQTTTVITRRAHAVMHCIPVPKESADMMPMYFKKAIEECETEWSMNKKLVRLTDGGVRACIPKGLPYFAVDFGEQNGYAHVIEDRERFPEYFGLEIIGSVLDVTPSTWLKPRSESFQDQSKRVVEFERIWTKHDCEKKLAA